MLAGRRTVTVEWGDCDPAGIVYFPRYYEWFDASTAALFEQAGLPKAFLLARYGSAGIAVVEISSRFMKPSTFGDRVVIESSVAGWRRSSFQVRHRLLRGDELAVESLETRVWTERASGGGIKSRPIPADVLALFAGARAPHREGA
jgi:4-hydroxybenzoyl-CoA thioesterase